MVQITKLPPGKAIGADDLQQWAFRRAEGKSGVVVSTDEQVTLQQWRKDGKQRKKREQRWERRHQRREDARRDRRKEGDYLDQRYLDAMGGDPPWEEGK